METVLPSASPSTKYHTWPLRGSRRKWRAQWEAQHTVAAAKSEKEDGLSDQPSFCTGSINLSRVDSAIELPGRIATFKCRDADTLNFSLLGPPHPGNLPLPYRLRRKHRIIQYPKTLHQLLASANQTACPLPLRYAQLSNSYNILATDPSVIDLLLICLRTVEYDIHSSRRRRSSRMKLLLDCPISAPALKDLIDRLPALSIPQLLVPPVSALAPPDICPQTTRLLAWLLSSPFTCLTSITPSSNPALQMSHTVSMGIIPFLVTTQPRHKEALFTYHTARLASRRKSKRVAEEVTWLAAQPPPPPFPSPSPSSTFYGEQAEASAEPQTAESFAVYHGTCPSRLPSILSKGLKIMSRTRYQRNGRVDGSGIYLCTDPLISLQYSTPACVFPASEFNSLGPEPVPGTRSYYCGGGWYGGEWNAEGLGKIRILLVCELAGLERGTEAGEKVYVVKDEGIVAVRLVLVLTRQSTGSEYEMERWMHVKKEVERVVGALRATRLGR